MSLGRIPCVDLGTGYETLETDDFIACWKGFLFVRGGVAGADSAARILREWRRTSPERAFGLAKGSFAFCAFDKQLRSVCCAVDPFGLMRLFVSERTIGDDFFSLVRHLGADPQQIDREALAAFFRFGFYDRQRMLDRRTKSLAGNAVAHIAGGAAVRLLQKNSASDDAQSGPFDFDSYMRDLAVALKGQRISLDLTGGFDSRLVAACLAHTGATIAEAVTSGQDGNRDVRIAAEIAAKLRLPHVWDRHRIAGFEDRALNLLHLTHGQMGLLTYDHMFQIQQGRLARGMTLGVGGAGGELWKDFLWLQDFPRLGGAPNFERLYRRRFEPRQPSGTIFAPGFAVSFEAAAGDYLAEMQKCFGGLPRTEAYDAVYADMRLPFLMGPSITAGIRAGLPHFSPLLDRDGVNASMHGPRRERLFSRWHRRTIARVAPELTKQRTTEGLSARSGISAIADLPFYLADKAGRAAQKIAQRLDLPDVVRHTLEDSQTLAYARRLGLGGDAVAHLKAFGIIGEGITPDQFSRAEFDRALTAGLALLEITG
jgi:hypothetical protein